MASYFPNLRRDNIALYTIPLFWAISISPRFYSTKEFELQTREKMDSRQPRAFTKSITDNLSLGDDTRGRLMRAEGAVANSFENFGPFCAAVAAGSAARLDAALLNGLTLGYLASRVAYTWLYVNGDTKAKATARSAVYMSGLGMLFAIFVEAGKKLNRALA